MAPRIRNIVLQIYFPVSKTHVVHLSILLVVAVVFDTISYPTTKMIFHFWYLSNKSYFSHIYIWFLCYCSKWDAQFPLPRILFSVTANPQSNGSPYIFLGYPNRMSHEDQMKMMQNVMAMI